MLRLSESIRQNDPSMQAMMETVENAPRLTEMVLAAWRLGLALACQSGHRRVGPARGASDGVAGLSALRACPFVE